MGEAYDAVSAISQRMHDLERRMSSCLAQIHDSVANDGRCVEALSGVIEKTFEMLRKVIKERDAQRAQAAASAEHIMRVALTMSVLVDEARKQQERIASLEVAVDSLHVAAAYAATPSPQRKPERFPPQLIPMLELDEAKAKAALPRVEYHSPGSPRRSGGESQ